MSESTFPAAYACPGIYGFGFAQNNPGWPGAGFNRERVALSVRRVTPTPGKHDRNEAQLSFSITEFKGERDRMFQHHGSLCLTAAQARKLALVLCPELAP